MFISVISIDFQYSLLLKNDKEDHFSPYGDLADKKGKKEKKMKPITLGSHCGYVNQLILP